MVISFPRLFFSSIFPSAGPMYLVVSSNMTRNGLAQEDYVVGSRSHSQ